MTYELKEEYIELYKLIKILDLVDSGGQAKLIISEGNVIRNGEVETRKRAKIESGDTLQIADVIIEVI
ncbi:RNA-binding S4 domain-containing protein [Sulfurimonas lithotrophica]|uniref:RNA-binding S4 domain-containing protein n=1 Tax=Sulfurimonas lithotrophica TaxID=2590022 RepID=A0A5P8P442_9BACT|nr:RNA-binding S4 domain-containing protein [Sulfurimonas lithotrophica]